MRGENGRAEKMGVREVRERKGRTVEWQGSKGREKEDRDDDGR